MQISMMQRRMPQALSMLRLIWFANSIGLNCCVPRIMCLVESRTLTRDTYLSGKVERVINISGIWDSMLEWKYTVQDTIIQITLEERNY